MPGQVGGALAGFDDLGDGFALRLGQRTVLQQAGIPHDADQQVVEVVGDAAGEHAQAFELLAFELGGLQALALRDIGDERQGTNTLRRLDEAEPHLHRKLGAVLVAGGEFKAGAHGPGLRRAEEAGDMARVLPAPFLRHQHHDLPADQFLARVAGQLQEPGVYLFDAPLLVHPHDSLGGGLEIRLEFGGAEEDCLVRLLLLGNVGKGADPLTKRSVLVEDRNATHQEVPVAAPRQAHAVFALESAFRADGLAPLLLHARAVFGVDGIEPVPALALLQGVPGEIGPPGPADLIASAGSVGGPNHLAGGLEQSAVTCFAREQFALGQFPLGDVAAGEEVQSLGTARGGTPLEVDGVAPSGAQGKLDGRAWPGVETGKRIHGFGKALLGDEVHEARADQLLARDAQEAAEAVIHVHEAAAGIHNHDAVVGGLEERAISFFVRGPGCFLH